MEFGIIKEWPSRTYKLKAPGVYEHSIYFTIGGNPDFFFINIKRMEDFHLITPLMTAWSRHLEDGRATELIIKDMKGTFDPRGGYTIPDGSGRVVPSFVHHLGLIFEEYITTIKKEIEMSETNFLCVKRWMDTIGQDISSGAIVPSISVLELREELIREEASEAITAFKELMALGIDSGAVNIDTGETDMDPKALIHVVKELADVLVVVYGAFVAIGVDGDRAMNIIMANNFGKVEHGEFRGDGKLIVDSKTKKRLKKEVNEKLQELLSHGA